MTAWQSTDVIPVKAIKFIEKHKCPICKKRLSTDENCSSITNNDEYMVWTECSAEQHYTLDMSWLGDEPVGITAEQIEFHYAGNDYTIQKEYLDHWINEVQKIETVVKITPLDEVGNPDNEKTNSVTFDNDYFDFKKFSAKKFASLIKTLIVFK